MPDRKESLKSADEFVLEEGDLDVVRAQPQPNGGQPPKRVAWKVVELVFDSVDEGGFGHATDPATRDEFLLNSTTIGFPSRDLKPGTAFRANVTRAHFVQRVEAVGRAGR